MATLEQNPAAPASPSNVSILLCDDEPRFRAMLDRVLRGEGHRVIALGDGREAIDVLSKGGFDVVITDIRMPGVDGFDVIGAAKRAPGSPAVIAITGYASIDDTVRAIRNGATDYLAKPFPIDRLLEILSNAVRERTASRLPLGDETPLLPDRSAKTAAATAGPVAPREPPAQAAVGQFIGESAAMKQVYSRLLRFAQTDATVLIQGETGTGKELAAAALHDLSPRKRGPLVRVNCANIDRALFESALFGHVRGAFTGALGEKAGLFHAAEGGTIFLDEVGEIALDMQSKLLRVIETKEFLRVGATTPERVNVRVVAASNRDLEAAANRGRFREDLYFRLSGCVIAMPPLRERKDDIPLLVRHLLARPARELGKEPAVVSPDAMARLCAFDWPGNVREIENTLRSIVAIAAGPTIEVNDLPPRIAALPPVGVPLSVAVAAPSSLRYRAAKRQVLDEFERRYFEDVLSKAGSISAASRLTGLDRKSLRQKLRRLGLAPHAKLDEAEEQDGDEERDDAEDAADAAAEA